MFMKKKRGVLVAVILSLTLFLAACGEKSKESVVAKLDEKVEAMDGYKAKAEMKMSTGQEEQKYEIDIWYKQKDFYRVSLANDQDEKESQIILKNEDGVFVLTPALSKSFKFQTDWPDNSSQPYLYASLVTDVKQDDEADFEQTDTHYIFRTKTNYQSNNNLPYQEIYFNKKDYTPELVKVLDKDKKALVEVQFSEFDVAPTFEKADFNVDENLGKEEGNEEEAKDSETETEVSGEGEDTDSFTVVFPLEMVGSELTEKKEVEVDGGQRVIMTFTGDKDFTLIQEQLTAIPTSSLPKEVHGDIVNLGFTIGALSENTIEWSYEGMDFYLASKELTKEELIEVAQSVQGKEAK